MTEDIKGETMMHLKILSKNPNGHFPLLSVEQWISNLFAKSVDEIISNENLKNDLIEVREMSDLKGLHSGSNSLEFWASHLQDYPNLATEALRVAFPFVTTLYR